MDAIFYFCFAALMTLVIEFNSDLKTMLLDSRRNWFMQGITIALCSVTGNLYNYLILVLILIIFNLVVKKIEKKKNRVILGDGDKELLRWLVPGLIIINFIAPILFLVFFMLGLILLGYLSRRFMFEKAPCLIVILPCFVAVLGMTL